MPKRYIVRLSEQEQHALKALVSIGKAALQNQTRQHSAQHRCQRRSLDLSTGQKL